ncbi:MAG: MBL fold metallo-hydrolase [bacterium]
MRRIIFFSLVLLLVQAYISQAGLQIHILDVGQGDCTLIISPTGETLLFDAGINGIGTGVVIPYLQNLGLTALDYIACSHYHVDHIGGIDEVVNYLGIDSVRVAVLDRGWSYTTATYRDYESAVAPKRRTINDGEIIDLGGGVTVTCVAVNGNGVLSPPFNTQYDENDLCVCLRVRFGDFEFFVAGDLSGVNSSYYHDIESSVAPEVGDIDVYRVNHHGSASNSNTSFVSTLLPEVSIISVGTNSYGHPTQTVIDRLVNYGSYIYQTELGSGGTIPSGHGEVVNGHIIIEVERSFYLVNGDLYSLNTSGTEHVVLDEIFAYPNPFHGSVFFRLPSGYSNSLKIYAVDGRLLTTLMVDRSENVDEAIRWDGYSESGSRIAPGVYFVGLEGSPKPIIYKIIRR